MADQRLFKEELERVLKFEGYGNKSAPYWFLGIEEGGGSIDELRDRARLFDPVEDLHSALKKINREEILHSHVPTWRVMSKLTMAIQDMPGWQETIRGREYQANKLGRADGDTFLTELMPFPCPGIGVWPYELIYPTKNDYIEKVRPGRIRWLRSEFSAFQPRFVICYGKGNWRYYEEIFNNVEFRPELNEKIRVGQRGHSTVLLLPFLSYYFVSTALITQIADMFGPEHH